MKMFTAWSFGQASRSESILLPRKRPLISEKAVLNMASPDLRFVGTGGTGGPVKFWGNNANSLGNYRVIYELN